MLKWCALLKPSAGLTGPLLEVVTLAEELEQLYGVVEESVPVLCLTGQLSVVSTDGILPVKN